MAPADQRPTPRRWGRRGFLKGAGASALATAAVVFGKQSAAQAQVQAACCFLERPPSSWSYCYDHRDYIWACTKYTPYGVCYRYECCEAACSPYGTCAYSAYRNVGIC